MNIQDEHAGNINWTKRRRGKEGKKEEGEEGEGGKGRKRKKNSLRERSVCRDNDRRYKGDTEWI